jgi:hypothetical protein
MEFYPSLTINRCHLERLCEIWSAKQTGNVFPFPCAIVSPLFARNGILERLYTQREQCKVIFDSGGFHIQQGRLDLPSASRRLQTAYNENGWADRFALPDAPITSLDSRCVIRQKLASTRQQYGMFPVGLSSAFRPKLLPVVHATTAQEVRRNAGAARNVGSKSLGFGGFATSGPNSGVNSFTPQSLRLLIQFAALCEEWKLDSHVFGIGGPAGIVVLHHIPVTTFDSAGWIRTAAYGNVYLPFLGAVNITGGAVSRRSVTRREFRRLCRACGHVCAFCADAALLMRSWPHRALHNYCTIADTARELDKIPPEHALERLRAFNPRFAGYLELVFAERSRLLQTRASRGSAAAL